ncbi:MAG: hypothetical protein WA635_02295 [Gallionella sp.]
MKLLNSIFLLILTVVIAMLPACGGGQSDAPAFNPVVSMNANIGSEPFNNYIAEYQAI